MFGKVFAGGFLVLWLPAAGSATILLFDQTRDTTPGNPVIPTFSGARLPADYGDRVTGHSVPVPGGVFTYGEAGEGFTPNVVVDILGGGGTPTAPRVSLWQTDYGDLVNVVFANQGSNTLNVLLTADPGFEAVLYGFDLGGWPNTDWMIDAVEVLSGGVTLFSQTSVLVEGDFVGPRHTSFLFVTPLLAPELHIRIDFGNLAFGNQDNIGIDNIRFGQTSVAEPTTLLLLLSGVALLPLVRARTQSRNRRLSDAGSS